MEKSILYRGEQICEPHCVGVICVRKKNNKFNLTPITHWHIFGNDDTPFLSFSLKTKSHSAYCIMHRNEFTFSVPDVSISKEVNLWGHRTGTYINKLEEIPVEISKLQGTFYAPAKSCVVYCCMLKQFVEFGNYFIFNCEIVETYTDNKLKPLFSYDTNTAFGGVIRPKSVINDFEYVIKSKKTK